MILASAVLTYALAVEAIEKCKPNPILLVSLPKITKELRDKGWNPRVVGVCRSVEEQREKVRLGYSQTMNSKHLAGRAVDIVDDRYWWNIPLHHAFWKDLGRACKKQGLVWGGDWKGFPDVAHCEMKNDS